MRGVVFTKKALPMNARLTQSPRHTWKNTRYPYIVIRLAPGMYSLRPPPGDLSRDVLLALAWSAMWECEGRLRTCLVLSAHEAL
jgi:hypothetical protein